tara:strand:- start:35148 stop:36218 length:1071 start_codon:yes stop_codon:yes gene_type:complete
MKKILIIEDNKDVRENTADILQLANYQVITADNGKVGLETIKENKPDLILCDIMMPELDGYGVLEALSSTSNSSSIPFIFLTAKVEKRDMRKGMNLGADDYLTKPFDENELLDAVKSRFKKHNFLKKEFSSTIQGVSKFLEEASGYMDIDHLSKDYSSQYYKKNHLLFMEGNPANTLYFVQSGTVKTFKTTEKGKEFVTGLYSSGSFMGQLSLLTDKRTYLESALILDDAELFEIPKTDFITLLHTNKDVAYKFVRLISNNLVDVQDQLVDMAYASVRQRVAKGLLDLHHKGVLSDKDTQGISIARDDFAGLIGTATETAIRMLTEFKDEGLITITSGRKIIITDEKALEDIVVFN